MQIQHQLAHVFRKAIPTIAFNAVQNLAVIAQCPLWRYVWHIDCFRTLHLVCKYPFDFPDFPQLVLAPPYPMEIPVFDSDSWTNIMAHCAQSLASHVWQCCPPLQQDFPLASSAEESKQQLLASCAHDLPVVAGHDFAMEVPIPWELGHPLFKMLFTSWASAVPDGYKPMFDLLPVQLSCVLSRTMSPLDLPTACLMTGSQFIFYWHRVVLALDRLIGSTARCKLLEDVFQKTPIQGGPPYSFKGDTLLTMIHLTFTDYMMLQQPSFGIAFDDFCVTCLQPNFYLCWAVEQYLSKVYQGKIQESYLDPIYHFFLLEHLSLTKQYPDIFPKTIPPMDWTFYFPPSYPTPSTQDFEAPQDPLNASLWDKWKDLSYPDLLKDLSYTISTPSPNP